MIRTRKVSRRFVLGGLFTTGALVVASRFVPDFWSPTPAAGQTAADASALHPTVYLGINPDGRVFIVTHRSEMGTGIRTSLPMVAADELDADWSQVTIEQAIGDERYGDQNTDGSKSVRDFFDAFRYAGASVRSMLVSAAAAEWGVPTAECSTSNHEVIHAGTGRRAAYASLVTSAARLPVPRSEELTFKTKDAWKFMGTDRPIWDLDAILMGTATFGMDVRVEGMAHASIERPPVLGGRVRTMDDTAARAVPGVETVLPVKAFTPPHGFQALGGVAVVAGNTWAALQGRRQLSIAWEDGPNASYESEAYRTTLFDAVSRPGKVVCSRGDVDAAFAAGGRTIEATYYVPHHAHATMEPPVAVADVRNGRAEIWAPVQNPQATQETVAAALGIERRDVICHVTLLGGGFGRKSKPDFAAEAALLSRDLGKPVKVVWTREDDIKFDFYHAVAAVHHRAVIGERGRPTAWLARSSFPPIQSTFTAGEQYGGTFEVGMGLTDMPFDVQSYRAENCPAPAHVRIGWFRSVANIYHVFTASSFVDELAVAAGRDPLEYQLDLLGPARILDLKAAGLDGYWNYGVSVETYPYDIGRLRRVLEVAAERSGWGQRPSGNGRGMGIAVARSFTAYVASVVEVEVTPEGTVRVPRVIQVIDAGIVVNPERVRAQLEGAAVMAVGLARSAEITAANGRVQQGNFNDFHVPRITDAPALVDTHIIESDDKPGGVGEPGLPPVVPALTNAIFAATGRRVRDLPLSKHGFS
ncbi:MAG: xanthine dehydrogenase family protein molybdopterin-binding subunit [Acidobacteria bacterium]|nr:xanthine dehydrogenase family protein molybdopterin-binding subunit [Acidobacteriota bacterium]